MDENIGCIVTIIIGAILFVLVCAACFAEEFVNKSNEFTWNNGICLKCSQRYELKAVYNGRKYYFCDGCGQEVVIY